MSMKSPLINKPAWVEALDLAKVAIDRASRADSPTGTDTHLRIAYAWIDVAKLYKPELVM